MRQFRDRLLSTTVICSASLFAVTGTANAQSTGQDAQSTPAVTQAAPIGPLTTTQGASASAADVGETIIVTGSRIPQSPNLTSSSPVTVINSAEVKFEGAVRAEDLLNQLPSVFADQGSTISNGSTGTATVNLRNLGPQRNLVLIDGRRLVPGDPVTASSADLNFIPTSLIKSVEVLTGGASSVYGADAVTGVVNFKLDTEFEGLRIDSQYSIFQHNNGSNQLGSRNALNGLTGGPAFSYPDGNTVDGPTFQGTLVFGAGTKDGRGHVTAYVGYQHQDAVTQNDRDFSACNLAANSDTTLGCAGSSTGPLGRFTVPKVFGADGTVLQNSATYHVAGNNFAPGTVLFNFAPYNFFQRSDERYQAGAFAHYDVSDNFKPYLEFMFLDDRTTAQIAPSGVFSGQANVVNGFSTVNCNNPLLSAQQLSIACAPANLVGGPTNPTVFTGDASGPYNRGQFSLFARRNVEGGPRQDDLRHTDYRIVVGAKGDIIKGFSYDVYAQFANVIFQENYNNEFSVTRFSRALDVVANPTAANGGVTTAPAGAPICRSVLNGTDPNCVPYNIFQAGGVTQAALNYIQVPGFQEGNTKETVISGSISGRLGEYGIISPFANDGVGIAIGGEYRRESLELRPDLEFQTNDLAGQGAATLPISGSYDVGEGFVELRLPLIQDKPFFQEFSIDAGYRYSSYSLQGKTDTYKIAGTWQPISGLSLRAGYNRAVRAPNIQELFAPQRVQLDGATDPCSGVLGANGVVSGGNPLVNGNGTGFTAAQCARQGVTAQQYGNILSNPANQYNGLTGGNTGLRPEKADTVTVGVVLRPKFLPRFTATVDAFDIRVNNTIGVLGADNIIQQCGNGLANYCALIHRDNQGSLFISPTQAFVVDTNLNGNRLFTRGIDVSAAYTQPTARFGTFGLSFNGTYLDKLVTTTVGALPIDCAGFYGTTCGIPSPAFRSKTRLSWDVPFGMNLSLQWRYDSAVRNDANAPGIDTFNNTTINNRIPSYSYFDLAATFRVTDKASFRLGVNNITDTDPPIVASQYLTPTFGNGNTFPAVYDALGRYIFAGFSLDF